MYQSVSTDYFFHKTILGLLQNMPIDPANWSFDCLGHQPVPIPLIPGQFSFMHESAKSTFVQSPEITKKIKENLFIGSTIKI